MFRQTARAIRDASKLLSGMKSTSSVEIALYTSRPLTTQNHVQKHDPLPANAKAASKDELRREFMSVWPDIVRDLTGYAKRYEKDSAKWFAKSLQYNVPNGKKNRGLSVVHAYKMFAKPDELTEDKLRLAHILGWCVEIYSSVFLMTDDMMDGSDKRRGQKCWYKMDDVGYCAINDSMMIENGIYFLLKKYFAGKDYYNSLVELFHETTFITTIGQFQDVTTAGHDVEKFTMEKYKTIVINKTANSFYLPVALAMQMAGCKDPEMFRQAKTILFEIGSLFQVQDDFIDCFGDPARTGEIGLDIQNGRCSWLAVVAMQRATKEQKEVMKECYGQKDPAKVERIKQLYEDLALPLTYEVYEEESYNIITTHIQQVSRGLPHKLFFKIVDKIYRRTA